MQSVCPISSIHFTYIWHSSQPCRSERHAFWCLVEPRHALSRDALEVVAALLSHVAEAVWICSILRRHVCSPLQRIAMIGNPSWLLIASVWVLEIRITLKIMLALRFGDLGMCEFRM